MHFLESRQARWRQCDEQLQPTPCDRDGAQRGSHRERETLGQVMPCKITAIRADGASYRRLQAPSLEAHEKEVGDVRCRDEHHDGHGGKEYPERLRHEW